MFVIQLQSIPYYYQPNCHLIWNLIYNIRIESLDHSWQLSGFNWPDTFLTIVALALTRLFCSEIEILLLRLYHLMQSLVCCCFHIRIPPICRHMSCRGWQSLSAQGWIDLCCLTIQHEWGRSDHKMSIALITFWDPRITSRANYRTAEY